MPYWMVPTYGPGCWATERGDTELVYPVSMTFPRYPEVVLTARRPEIFAVKEVVATEKLHGSNSRIHFPCGMSSLDDIGFGSHDVEYTPGQPFPLGRFRDSFQRNPELLTRMWEVIKSYGFSDATVFGEVYGPGTKTKGVKYSTGTEQLYRTFGIMIGENFLTYDLFCEVADKMGLARVHEVWRGAPSMEAFDALLEKPSTEAQLHGIDDPNNIAEGVVIQSTPLLRNVFGEWLIVKHKARKFAEVAPVEPKAPRGPNPADDLAARYVTEGRLVNAVGRLHDRGTVLSVSMKDMPVLLDEVVADLHKECAADIAAAGITDDKNLRGAVSRVLGPLYRTMITAG